MTTQLVLALFAALTVAAVFSMVKIQRAELRAARAKRDEANEIERKRQLRLEEFRAKCCRPDGD